MYTLYIECDRGKKLQGFVFSIPNFLKTSTGKKEIWHKKDKNISILESECKNFFPIRLPVYYLRKEKTNSS